MWKERFVYYRLESGRIFKLDRATMIFYLLEKNGAWIPSGSIMATYYDAASVYEQISEQEALEAAREMEKI